MSVRSGNTGEAGESFPSGVATRAIGLVTAISAIAAAIRPCRPIGSNVADRSYAAGFGALVAYCGATASLPALAWAAVVLSHFRYGRAAASIEIDDGPCQPALISSVITEARAVI